MLYHTMSHGPDENAFRSAFVKACQVAKQNSSNEVLFKTHTLDNMSGVPTDVLGDKLAKELLKNRKASVNGITLFFETERTKSQFCEGVILAPFVNDKLLRNIHADQRGTDSIYIPWAEVERDDYINSNNSSIVI